MSDQDIQAQRQYQPEGGRMKMNHVWYSHIMNLRWLKRNSKPKLMQVESESGRIRMNSIQYTHIMNLRWLRGNSKLKLMQVEILSAKLSTNQEPA